MNHKSNNYISNKLKIALLYLAGPNLYPLKIFPSEGNRDRRSFRKYYL